MPRGVAKIFFNKSDTHTHAYIYITSTYAYIIYNFVIIVKMIISSNDVSFSWQTLLFKIYMKVKVLVAQSCLTLCIPADVAHQAPLSMEFSRQ